MDEKNPPSSSQSPPHGFAAGHLGSHGIDTGFIERAKEGLRRLMPVLEVASRLTSTPVDDYAVEFLKKLVQKPSEEISEFMG